ncbi:thioredoxin reductase [Rhodovulum imhoffii]|uniref:Thioredoxin reductase n=1 Tax=Rhodovulum imhoffii TaxID=365340 RepID=A0A2T5BST8_9RHOB|nr:NAD(P)/FAD-dependent oxidoreductase [Rhodovulum imhoffii]MBK5933727.1 FAD/NAD(P)-binding oxidoreductase [Rhodovulum imhoffii]PTN02440.1 thioredoxin reductase [Rhodovulum imhoffii]
MGDVDFLIIGAGPAGMAAAAQAARLGMSTAILDEQPAPGGQIYRGVEVAGPVRGRILGKDFLNGVQLAQGVRHAGIRYIPGATVWKAEAGGSVAYSVEGAARTIRGRRLLLATGALERPVPLPGWTLPGVMTVGAAQILLKQSGVVPRRAVIAGSGPLLYLVAAQMVRAGRPPLALVETPERRDLLRALRHLGGALRGWRYMAKGVGWFAELARAGVPRYRSATELRIEGTDKAEALSFVAGGRNRCIACETVLLHEGVVPNTQASRAMNLPHHWDAGQRCFVPDHDVWGQTAEPRVYVAGDGAGIGGAQAAEQAGCLAALHAAAALGHIGNDERDRRGARHLRRLAREMAARPFLEAAYPPGMQTRAPADDTIVCRCEEVTAGDIRRHAALGCRGPNQAKAFGRAGMGPCQGRYCGLTVTGLLAAQTGQTPAETGYYRIRPPLKPITVAELAALEPDPGENT